MQRPRRTSRERRLRPRYKVAVEARATIQLFGSTEVFDMTTENISESGLLLNSPIPMNHLNSASILEVSLFLDPEHPVKFFAKWIRNATGSSVGIIITEITPETQDRLDTFILNLSEKISPESEF